MTNVVRSIRPPYVTWSSRLAGHSASDARSFAKQAIARVQLGPLATHERDPAAAVGPKGTQRKKHWPIFRTPFVNTSLQSMILSKARMSGK
jgi:hypothetical protein